MVEEVKKENNNLVLGELEKFKGKGEKMIVSIFLYQTMKES